MSVNVKSRIFTFFVLVKQAGKVAQMKDAGVLKGLVIFCTVMICFSCISLAAEEVIQINSYYGQYDAARKISGFPSKSLKGPVMEKWVTPVPGRAYHIGVLFPHIQDAYFNTANYGIISHARRLGLKVTFYTAGAYLNFGNQRMQLNYLASNERVDGILLTSVDYKKMDPFVKQVSDVGIPVVALINDIHAPTIGAKIFAPFFDIGYRLGQYVLKDSADKPIKIAFFPGPESSEWAPATYNGFTAAISKLRPGGKEITLLEPLYGDTRPDVQMLRLNTLNHKKHHNIDYIIGNAVAAVAAADYLKEHDNIHPGARILSTYITTTVYEQIKNGLIMAAPSDQTISQCKIALDMVVKILNKEEPGKDFPFLALPVISLITRDNIDQFSYESLFGEKNFTPVFDKIDW